MFMEMRAGEFWQGLGCPEMGIVTRGYVLYLLGLFVVNLACHICDIYQVFQVL